MRVWACYSRMDSDLMSMFLTVRQLEKNSSERDSNDIVYLCLTALVWTPAIF